MANAKFRLFSGALKIAVTALALFLCLFADSHVFETTGAIGSILSAFAATFRDSEMQWMVFLCVAVNLLTFLLLQYRVSGSNFWRTANPSLWLAGLLFLGALVYAFNYPAAAQSTQSLMLLAGAALGSGAAVWACFEARSQKPEVRNGFLVLVISILVILLTVASLWHPNLGSPFEYRGHARWSGPWDNPNIYGLLIGTGIVLAIGSAVLNFEFLVFSKSNTGSWKGYRKWWKVIFVVLCLFAATLMGRGLLHSYSRGAWLATLCGLAYLFWSSVQCPPVFAALRRGKKSEVQSRWIYWLKKNWLPFSVILASAFALSFWQFRHTEWHPARRVFSSANMNDFSWRNRIAAWKGTLQIMAEHPWLGAGWHQPESLYENYYLPPKVNESAAVQLNDYLTLGATIGIPALLCFVTYIWLSLNQKSGVGIQMPEVGGGQGASPTLDFGLPPSLRFVAASWASDWSRTVCRAGTVVLIIGFWFDGGLFNLSTASMFWILLELGASESIPEKVVVPA
jgi:hypothetical protein